MCLPNKCEALNSKPQDCKKKWILVGIFGRPVKIYLAKQDKVRKHRKRKNFLLPNMQKVGARNLWILAFDSRAIAKI
jgi:hypothetical protein